MLFNERRTVNGNSNNKQDKCKLVGNDTKMSMNSNLLVVKSIQKTYQIAKQESLTVLTDISFTTSPGEVIILMGPSGSGKSTLLNLLAGLEKPSSGQIIINDVDLFSVSEDARTDLRRDIFGIVFQFFELHQGLTCQETLELKLIINKTHQPENIDQIHSLFSLVGLEDKNQTLVDELSRGEKQRVAIARALVNNPKIILADEPTGALDYETAREILQLLRTTAKELNSVLLISTHDFNVPQDGDRILQLEDGRLIKDQPNILRSKYLQESGVEDLVVEYF